MPKTMTRPGSLAEAVRRTREGGQSFSFNISEFLDEFYLDGDSGSRASRLIETPELLEASKINAYVGAIAEHLSRRWRVGRAPCWSEDPARFLDEPYFTAGPAMHPILLMESPVAFRRRFIFTEAEPLRRARMPEDGRWWAYETLRSGLVPPPNKFPELRMDDFISDNISGEQTLASDKLSFC